MKDFKEFTKADWAALGASLRDSAKVSDTHAAESWERSDTDGFLSQWASGISSSLALTKADICDAQGLDQFTGLFEGTRRVRAKQVTFQDKFTHGTKTLWLLDDSEDFGRKWIPVGARSRVQKTLGLTERSEVAPAWACTAGGGTGLAGCSSVFVKTFRTGDEWGQDAILVEDNVE